MGLKHVSHGIEGHYSVRKEQPREQKAGYHSNARYHRLYQPRWEVGEWSCTCSNGHLTILVAYLDVEVRGVTRAFPLVEEQRERTGKHSNQMTGFDNTDMYCTKNLPCATGIPANFSGNVRSSLAALPTWRAMSKLS